MNEKNEKTKKIVFRVPESVKRSVHSALIQKGLTIQDVYAEFTEQIASGTIPKNIIKAVQEKAL